MKGHLFKEKFCPKAWEGGYFDYNVNSHAIGSHLICINCRSVIKVNEFTPCSNTLPYQLLYPFGAITEEELISCSEYKLSHLLK